MTADTHTGNLLGDQLAADFLSEWESARLRLIQHAALYTAFRGRGLDVRAIRSALHGEASRFGFAESQWASLVSPPAEPDAAVAALLDAARAFADDPCPATRHSLTVAALATPPPADFHIYHWPGPAQPGDPEE